MRRWFADSSRNRVASSHGEAVSVHATQKFLLAAERGTRVHFALPARLRECGAAGICASRGGHASKLNNHSQSTSPPILLTIAGFDPSCGAGVAADLKTFAAHNCYGVAAVTALTVQSTQGVRTVHATPAATLRAQLDALAEDATIAGVKIGMLANRANASAVAEFLDNHKFAHVVLDPVSRPTAGNADLLDAAGLNFVRDELLKRASVITPNMPEAEFLTGMEVKDLQRNESGGAKAAGDGRARCDRHRRASWKEPIDVLCEATDVETFGGDHVKSPNTHGSGCTFSSAIAAQLACGPATPRRGDSGESLRHQGHREILSRSARAPGRSISSSASIRSRRRAASTKFRSTACIPPPNPPRTNLSASIEDR